MDYGGHSGMGNTNYYCDDVLKSLTVTTTGVDGVVSW